MFGLKTVWRDATPVQMSDPARTVIDMLAAPATGGGIDHVAECLVAFAKSKGFDRKLLIAYVSVDKSAANRSGPYRFFFYTGDRGEPQHVHVERDDRIAKFWLDPIRLQSSGGFSRIEIARIEKLVNTHRIELVEVWNGYFDG